MLVCAVLVVATAIAVPVVRSLFTGSRIDAARDVVRSSLTQARNFAVRDSRPYRFEIMNNTGTFRISPEELQGAQGIVQSLPEEVIFCTSSAGSGWSTVAVFLPDGTANQDALISIRSGQSAPITLRLRASTGSLVSLLPPASNRPS
jgi:Tfp pilus assembly protein FimT